MVKLLLTWHAYPPDPPYWKYMNIDGLMISLSSFKRKKLIDSFTLRGLKKSLGLNSVIIVDSITKNLWKYGGMDPSKTQAQTLYLQYMLGADLLVHKDFPLIKNNISKNYREKYFKRTLFNAELALKISERLGIDVILVIQGWDLNTYLKCAKVYQELGAKYMGIGSLASKRSIKYITNIIKGVKKIIGRKTYIHVFGMMNPKIIPNIAKYIDSVDVSTPIKAAIAREVIIPINNTLKRIPLSIMGIDNLKNIVKDKRLTIFIEELEKTRTLHELKQKLAIFNAYALLSWLRRIINIKGDGNKIVNP